MDIAFEDRSYCARVGHCVVIPKGTVHSYRAPEQSTFLIADMADLPDNASRLEDYCAVIDEDLSAFCGYAQTHLQRSGDATIASLLFSLFRRLLEQQDFAAKVDDRILRALAVIDDDLTKVHTVAALADVACLSASQFKSLFKRYLGRSCTDYLTMRRMERARTLLMNTDYPIGEVAYRVGYEDASAFARRFKSYFGQPPHHYSRKN